MRGPLAVLVAASVATTLFAGFSGEAHAQKKRVVVESFKGPAAPKYRIAVMKSLHANGLEVIPDRALVKVEADLGLNSVAQNYGAIARELKLTGFVSGIITGGRRPKARIIVRNADGKPIGGQIFQATSAPKLMAMVSAGAGPKAAAVLANQSPAGGGGAPAADEPAAVAAADEEKPRRRRGEEEAAPAEAAEESAADGDADAEVAAGADDEEPTSKKKAAAAGTGLRIAGVMRLFSRNFTYSDNKVGRQQGYQAPEAKFNNLPLVPAPGFAVEFFPNTSFGVHASYNKAIAGSKDSSGSVYTTNAFSYLVGGVGRFSLGSMMLEPGIAYGSHVFQIENFAARPDAVQVAGVDYKHARIGGSVRVPLDSGGSVFAGGHYLYILSAGEILSDKYFKGNSTGGELSAGVTLPLSFAKGFDVSVAADFRRIVFAFTPNKTATRIAGGATDQYIGLNLSVGYNLNL